MKIMHLITGLGIGGAEKQILRILPELDGDHIIVSLTDENAIAKEIENKNVKIFYLHYHAYNLIPVILQFRCIIKQEKPDILNTYLIHADLFGRIFGRLFGIRTIICSVRNKLWNRKILLFLDKLTSFLVDVYTPNSPAVRDFLVKQKKLPAKKMKVIPNGVDINLFSKKIDVYKKRKELSIHNKYVITCVASFKPQKDHTTLLRAFSKLKQDAVLLLVGDGKEKKAIEKYASDLGIKDKVLFLGNRKDVAEILSITDIFVLPSKHEGMSNALLEAMASKCALVASNIPENSTIVKNTREALLFAPGDAEQLALHIETLLTDIKKRKELGKSAYNHVHKNYSFDTVIYQLNLLYKDLKRTNK